MGFTMTKLNKFLLELLAELGTKKQERRYSEPPPPFPINAIKPQVLPDCSVHSTDFKFTGVSSSRVIKGDVDLMEGGLLSSFGALLLEEQEVLISCLKSLHIS